MSKRILTEVAPLLAGATETPTIHEMLDRALANYETTVFAGLALNPTPFPDWMLNALREGFDLHWHESHDQQIRMKLEFFLKFAETWSNQDAEHAKAKYDKLFPPAQTADELVCDSFTLPKIPK